MMSEDGRHSPTDGSWAWPRSGQTALKRVMPPEPRIVGTGRDPPVRRRSCNCKRSNCLKLYCECFANGVHCDKERCNCITCHNNLANEHLRREAIDIILDRNPHAFRPKIVASSSSPNSTGATRHNKGCHCKRSNCLKKYCECFQANVVCTDRCRCQDCKNYEGSEARERLINVFTANAGLPGHESQSGPSSKRPRLEHASSSLPPATTAVAATHNQRGEMYDKAAGARAQTTVEANSASLLNVMNTTVVDDLVMILVSAAAAAAASAPSPPPPQQQILEPPLMHPSGMHQPPIMMPHAGGLGGGSLVGAADMLVGGGTDPFATHETVGMMSSQHTHTTVAADSQGSTGSEPLMDLGAEDELGCNEAFTLQAEEDLGSDGLDEQEEQRNEDSVGVRQETAVMQHLSIGVRQLAELVSKHRMR